MSYDGDQMKSLSNSIRSLEALKYQIKILNENKDILERLTQAIERSNELKEMELGLKKIDRDIKRK